ncbi:MAG: hypothetical protein IJW18_06720 [Lachnospiraceae bacterium]|nr:hypothetical protein [Lachnospiraceae bacterium]
MIKHELYKLISAKAIVALTFIVLIVNVILLWKMEKDKTSYTAADYMNEWATITEEARVSGWEVVLEGFGEKLAVFDETGLSAKERFALRNSADYYKKALYTDIQTELAFLTDYAGYLEGIDSAAKRYEKIVLFGNVDGYAYRDIMKMKAAYADVDKIELIPAPSAGIEMAATSGVTDILALIVLLCVAVTVWLKEREHNMLLLLRTTCHGRVKLAGSKLTVMIMSCIFLGVGLYGGNAIAASIMYGLGDLGRPLASVYDYGHTLWEISAGEFLILNALFKIIAYIWVTLLISAVCCKIRSSVAAFGGIVIVGAAGCLMYYKIPYLSLMVAFKYLNPFAILKTELLFADYNGLNFFGYPVDYRLCMAVLLTVGVILFTILTMRFFTGYIIKGTGKSWNIITGVFGWVRALVVKLRRNIEKHTSLFVHELHRILVCYGAGLVLVVLIVFVVYDSQPYEVKYSDLEYYCEHMYLNELKGPVTQEKRDYIDAEEARLKGLSDEYSRAQRRALSMIRQRLAYIEKNEGACFIYDTPHNSLTAAMGNRTDILRAVICMVPLALVMPCFFAPDLQSGVCKITDVTKKGKRELPRLRYVTGTVLAMIIAAVAHIPYFVQVMVSYDVDMEVLSYPVNSLTNLAELGNGINIGVYYALIYMLRVVFTVLGAFLVYGLSRLLKSQAYAILTGFIVLVVPALAVLYDSRLEAAVYPYSAMLGNLFIQKRSTAVMCVIAVAFVCVIMKLTIRIRSKK